MSNTFVSELKNQKKLWFSLLGLVAVIVAGTTMRTGNLDLGGYDTYPGTNYSPSATNNSSTVASDYYNKYKSAPLMDLTNGADYRAELETSEGNITIDLYEKDTPVTVNNFVFLANEGYYNGQTFHFVKNGTLIQTGDPLGDGSGGPGYVFKDEIDAQANGLDEILVKDAIYLNQIYDQLDESTAAYAPANLLKKKNLTLQEFYEQDFGYTYSTGLGTYKIGAYSVAMANSGANSNGSQFFIASKAYSDKSLIGKHTVFGKVISGKSIVDKIESASLDAMGSPRTVIKLLSVTIIEN